MRESLEKCFGVERLRGLAVTAAAFCLAMTLVACGTEGPGSSPSSLTDDSGAVADGAFGAPPCSQLLGTSYDSSDPPASCDLDGEILVSTFYDCEGVLTIAVADFAWAQEGGHFESGDPNLDGCTSLR